MKKGYTNRTEIENYLLITIDESFHEQVDRWIEQIESYIEGQTGRVFIADEDPSVRRYDGDGSSILFIDDAVEVMSVKVGDDNTILYDDESGESDPEFFLYPANGLPKTKIKGITFSKGKQNIRVSARWGYSEEVPADIIKIATVLVAGIINYQSSSEGEIQSKTIGRFSVTYKSKKEWMDLDEVKNVLDSYASVGRTF